MPRHALRSIAQLAPILSLVLLASPLAAQEDDTQPDTVLMERIQAVATRTERATFDVPVPVDVLDGERIDRLQADNVVADLFPLEAGLEVEGEGPFLGLPVLRGLSGNRVLVLVDGQRLNNSREAINFGGVQPGLVDVSNIASIEIVRGPASVLYGSDAIGGIVNIVTRKPELPAEGLSVSGSATTRYSTIDRQRTGAMALHFGTPYVGFAFRGSARDAGDYSSALGVVAHSGAETRSGAADLEWRPADDHALTLQWSTLRGEDIGVPGSGGVFTGFYPRTDRTKLSLGYEARDLAAATAHSIGPVKDLRMRGVPVQCVPVSGLQGNVTIHQSDAPGVQIGKSRSRSPGIRSLSSRASRARIQLRLPITVLISPLWAM